MSDERIVRLVDEAERVAVGMRMLARSLPNQDVLANELQGAGDLISAAHTRVRAELLRMTDRDLTVSAVDLTPRVVGRLRVEPSTRSAYLDGDLVEMSNMEFEILCVLAEDPVRVWKKADLYARVWGGKLTGQKTRTVDSHLCRLRNTLGGPPWVANRWGVGYSLLPASAIARPRQLEAATNGSGS